MKRDCGDGTRRTTHDGDKYTRSSPNISEGCKITSESASSTLKYESGRCTRSPALDDSKKRPHQLREQDASCAKKAGATQCREGGGEGEGVHTDLLGLANGERDKSVQIVL